MEREGTLVALEVSRREAEGRAKEARTAVAEALRSNELLRREMEQRVRVQERLTHLAVHDPLTGLPNRTHLAQRLAAEIAVVRRDGDQLALLYLDLDDFKSVNDTLGHAAGDDLLRVVAQRLRCCVREPEAIARMGGDEFALWVRGIDPTQAALLAQRIIMSISEPITVVGQRVFCGVSVGITLCPDDGDQVESLLSNADIAMYRAKQRGRNNFQIFDEELNEEVRRRAVLERALHDALPLKQISIAYQPQIELRAGSMPSVEALLRWTHPGHGIVPPDQFVPIAERCGLITDLGSWILTESCRQAAGWRAAGLGPVKVAVNVATAQFRSGGIVKLVADALADSGLEASSLELEVTESGVMSDIRDAAEILTDLAALGVTLAIDDFGTGYSSLSYLFRLPVSTIKIDRSFIRDVTSSQDAAVVTKGIVRLAEGLRMMVVAEGVETAGHVRFVRDIGCTLAQGYYFAKPLPPGQVAGILADPEAFFEKTILRCDPHAS